MTPHRGTLRGMALAHVVGGYGAMLVMQQLGDPTWPLFLACLCAGLYVLEHERLERG